MTAVNVGLIGYGLAGAVFHAPLICAEPGLQLAAVVSRRAEQIAQELPGVAALADPQTLFEDPAIELVVIATPNDSHADLAARALKAGKHVVVDKPFTIHSRDADALIALAEQQQRLLSVFHNRRWDADFLTLRRYCEAGELGEIYHYEARFDRFRPAIKAGWREQPAPGAGLLYDLGAHLIDQALQLFGMPEAVDAEILAQRPQASVDDWFSLRLSYGSRRVLLGVSSLMAGPGPHFSVHGERGSFLSFGLDGQEPALKQGQRPGMPGWGESDNWQARYTDAEGQPHEVRREPGRCEAYYRGIVASLRHRTALDVTAQQARAVIGVIEAAQRSSDEARLVAL